MLYYLLLCLFLIILVILVILSFISMEDRLPVSAPIASAPAQASRGTSATRSPSGSSGRPSNGGDYFVGDDNPMKRQPPPPARGNSSKNVTRHVL